MVLLCIWIVSSADHSSLPVVFQSGSTLVLKDQNQGASIIKKPGFFEGFFIIVWHSSALSECFSTFVLRPFHQ